MPGDWLPLSEKDLHQWDLLARFRQRLLAPAATPLHPFWSDPKRHAQYADYLSLFLFGLLNPALKTRRALCTASQWERVRREVCTQSLSLGSCSEAQHLVEPAALEKIFTELVAQVPGPVPAEPRAAWQQWFARDSSLFAALPRMSWALYGGGKAGAKNHAVRLHLSFHLLDDKPARAQITPGQSCERKVWRTDWQAGAAYVGDAYFAEHYALLGELQERGCRYVLRLCDKAVVNVEEELPVICVWHENGVRADRQRPGPAGGPAGGKVGLARGRGRGGMHGARIRPGHGSAGRVAGRHSPRRRASGFFAPRQFAPVVFQPFCQFLAAGPAQQVETHQFHHPFVRATAGIELQ